MKLVRIKAVARKEFLHVLRDPVSLGLAIVIPMMMLVLFGFALTLDVDKVPTIVWDQSRTGASRELISRFEGSPYFSVYRSVDNYRDIERAIDRREAMAALVVPADYGRDVAAERKASVQLIVDGSDANTATLAIGYADAITQSLGAQLAAAKYRRLTGDRLHPPLDMRARVWFNADLESRNYIIPGLIAVIMMVIAALLTSLCISREWENGTMEQLIATPVTPGELIVGKLVPYFTVAVCDTFLAVLMAEFVFDVPMRGSVALLALTSVLFLAGVLSMGMLISIVTKSQLLASQLAIMATFLPSFLLSGFIFPISNMPAAVQMVTYAVPARYFVTILKAIYLKGVGLEVILPQACFLVVFAALVAWAANKRLRKKLR